MARIVVLQHSPEGTPARLGNTLRDHGFRLDVRRLDLDADAGGGVVPKDLDDIHGVISLGGQQDVAQNPSWMQAEIELIKAAHEAQLPVIGICLGAQLIAKALGAEVGKLDDGPEAGFCRVDLTVPAQIETITAGISWTSHQFQCHGCEVKDVPAGATLLASSDKCKVQAFKAGLRTYAFQYHFECDRTQIEQLHHAAGEMFEQAGVTSEAMTKQADEHYPSFARLANRQCVNLAAYAFPFAGLTAV